MMRSLTTSLNSSDPMSPNQTGPSAQRKPVATRSTVAEARRYLAKAGSRISTAGSGTRCDGSQPAPAARAAPSTAAPASRLLRAIIVMYPP